MRLEGFMNPLYNDKNFMAALNDIEKNRFPLGIFGLSDSGRGYFINGIFEKTNKDVLIVTQSDIEAKNIYEDLLFYTPSVYYMPSREIVFYNVDAISGDLRWERLKVIREILNKNKKIIVSSIENLASFYIPAKLYRENILHFKVGDTYELSELSRKLVQCGYERCDIVENKGQFSLRGGILDVYSPVASESYRIEFFGDEVDSIRNFNVESQRSIDKAREIEIFPAKEIILDEDALKLGCTNISEDFKKISEVLKSTKKKEELENLKKTVANILELLKETWSFETVDSFLPYFYDKGDSFLDYFKDSIVICDDIQRCMGKMDSVYYEFDENYNTFLERGSILPRQAELLISKQIIKEKIQNSRLITLNIFSKSFKEFEPCELVSFSQISLQHYNGQIGMLIDDILDKKSKKYKTLILSGTRPRGERLVKTLSDRGIESVYKDTVRDIKAGEVVITFGNQQNGFEYPELKICAISDKQVFGQSKRKASRKKAKGIGKIKSFTELKIGDYVVHTNHGIGVYKGIKQLEIEGIKKDFLKLCYSGEDTLYVPVDQLDMVQKYIGSEGKAPKISKLSGSEWTKAKNKVKQAINEIAEDLLKLYAIRATLKGYSFSKDKGWQRQFEDEFPYEETPDQLDAIEDIKKDMESDKPMDRLLCGDVGYGKTEVAIRAAFKAVMDGKQVAFLVPTTILAEQHYTNMLQRFSDFPVKIDMVSRFRTPLQQKNALKEVTVGTVDILIGTHRLLQKDVKFKDLGLLIVDEEQRFGVSAKEKIKNYKKNIDVLTLTATPIPRTLHMSLVGVRDISVIETPPEERYPVQTYIVEYNDQLIRDAILREIARDGQVFFVYNRVESINEMAGYLSKLIPEAKVAIAHGQMTERELEKVMINFMSNEFNLLVCTTIIETGIDIQNVNTMIIYDADKMGLSQLYQLRGRVGRSNRMAYAYFTYRKDKILTEVAEKRLKAIKDFTELGSGFKIALRDLEIRGAGNMMGSAQHGHMASVGYDLYCRMLEDTIKLVRGDIQKEPIETTVELKVDAYIPSDYIEDENQKIEIYKKIAAIDSEDDMHDIEEEIEDRFSDIPACVYNLMNIALIRSFAKIAGIIEIKQQSTRMLITFESNERITQKLVTFVLENYKKRAIFKMGANPVIIYDMKDIKNDDFISDLNNFVKSLKGLVET